MSLALGGWGVLCSAGSGAEAFRAALGAARDGSRAAPSDVSSLYADALPTRSGHALLDFDVRARLGRKGTGALDRRTALVLVACRQALEESALAVSDANRQRIGVVIGTTWGSLTAMSDYTKESLLEERPYLVEPARFPNTVMNCAAGQAAIWHGLKGVNATIAGGALAFLNVLDYVDNLLRGGYADTLLAGAVEEFTPHTAWAHHLMHGDATPAGEAALMFVVERAHAARSAGRQVVAEVLAVTTGFAPATASGRHLDVALAGCIRRVLARAALDPHVVERVVLSGGVDTGEPHEIRALATVFGATIPPTSAPQTIFGACQAATGALQLATAIALQRLEARSRRQVALLTGWTPDGAVGAALVACQDPC